MICPLQWTHSTQTYEECNEQEALGEQSLLGFSCHSEFSSSDSLCCKLKYHFNKILMLKLMTWDSDVRKWVNKVKT